MSRRKGKQFCCPLCNGLLRMDRAQIKKHFEEKHTAITDGEISRLIQDEAHIQPVEEKEGESVFTISGGGGPGTGKRR